MSQLYNREEDHEYIRSRFFSFELEDQRSCNVFVEKKSYISRQQIDRKISKGILFFYPNETKVERGRERGTRIIGSNREGRAKVRSRSNYTLKQVGRPALAERLPTPVCFYVCDDDDGGDVCTSSAFRFEKRKRGRGVEREKGKRKMVDGRRRRERETGVGNYG